MTGSYDTLIRGARVVDGTGNPWLYGDVALAGDRIAAVAPRRRDCRRTTRARSSTRAGMVVCPGFIDIQSHSIMPLMVDGALALEDHPGRDDRDHGRGLDAGAVRRADRRPDRPRPARAGRSPEWARAGARLDALRRLAGGDGRARRLARTSARSSAAARCAQYARGMEMGAGRPPTSWRRCAA